MVSPLETKLEFIHQEMLISIDKSDVEKQTLLLKERRRLVEEEGKMGADIDLFIRYIELEKKYLKNKMDEIEDFSLAQIRKNKVAEKYSKY